MNNTNLNFPYEIKELEPEERLKILKACNASELIPSFDFVSVGPKKYKQLRPYSEEAADIYNIEIRDSDRYVITYPRSGTTMTQELVWLIENDFDYDKAKSIPLQKRFPYIELLKFTSTKWQDELLENASNKEEVLELLQLINMPTAEKLPAMTSPRYLKTHMPLSLLPPTLVDTAKVVYVARDPRDVAVSYFHLHRLIKCLNFPGTFKDFWNLFIKDLVRLTPLFEHVKEAWNLRNHPNLLFLFYENYHKDASATIRQIANFLGKEVTAEQVKQLCDHINFKNFKSNEAVNFQKMKEMRVFDDKEHFIRRGKVAGWRDYFDEEMTQQAEQWIADNLQDTDLRFPHF